MFELLGFSKYLLQFLVCYNFNKYNKSATFVIYDNCIHNFTHVDVLTMCQHRKHIVGFKNADILGFIDLST